jgi:hypothetical protein
MSFGFGFGELIFLLIPLSFVVLWWWALIDCLMHEQSVGNTKIVWVLVILFGSIFGALAYVGLRRPQRLAELGR